MGTEYYNKLDEVITHLEKINKEKDEGMEVKTVELEVYTKHVEILTRELQSLAEDNKRLKGEIQKDLDDLKEESSPLGVLKWFKNIFKN